MEKKINDDLLKQAMPIIEKIAKQSKSKTFAYFEKEDIYQEIYIICINALRHYDPKRGKLINYLRCSVRNRLFNLMRDRYFRPHTQKKTLNDFDDRINIINALPIDLVKHSEKTSPICSSLFGTTDPSDQLEQKELLNFILKNIDSEKLSVLKLLMDGKRIRKKQINDLYECVCVLIKEYNNE